MAMEEKIDHPLTTGSAKTDRHTQEEHSLEKRLMDLQRGLDGQKVEIEAIKGLMSGYQSTAVPSQSITTPRSTLDLIGSIPWEKPKAFLAFFAIVLFGIVRFANGAFYARLGLTPEDVGLSSAVILARSAMSVVLLAISLILLGFWAFSARRERWGLALLGVPMALLGLVLFRALFPLPGSIEPQSGGDNLYSLAIFLGGALIGFLVALQDDLLQRRRDLPGKADSSYAEKVTNSQAGEARQVAKDEVSARRRVIIVALALATALLLGLAGTLGYYSAGRVMDGKLLRCGCVQIRGTNINMSLPWVSGTPGFLAVRVQHAEVVWNTRPTTPPEWASLPMKNAMYIGQADGMIVVYDYDNDRPQRFPVGAVLLRVDPEQANYL
jgi:hypothetical protein